MAYMKYAFHLSPYTPARAIDGISVTKAGRIGLPKFFLATHGIERGTKAYLYWDSETRAMAIEFTRRADATAFPIVFTRHYGAFINARRFFRIHSLDAGAHTGRYSYVRETGEAIGLPEAASEVFVVRLQEE
jgi:hypothetical protein